MHLSIRLVIFIFGMLLIIGTIRLLLVKKMTERFSVSWLIGCFVILIFSLIPNLIDYMAKLFDISYPPTLILLFSTILLFWFCLYNSIHITILKRQIVELTQQKAVEDALKGNEKQVSH